MDETRITEAQKQMMMDQPTKLDYASPEHSGMKIPSWIDHGLGWMAAFFVALTLLTALVEFLSIFL